MICWDLATLQRLQRPHGDIHRAAGRPRHLLPGDPSTILFLRTLFPFSLEYLQATMRSMIHLIPWTSKARVPAPACRGESAPPFPSCAAVYCTSFAVLGKIKRIGIIDLSLIETVFLFLGLIFFVSTLSGLRHFLLVVIGNCRIIPPSRTLDFSEEVPWASVS
jgi:hypothetical protein